MEVKGAHDPRTPTKTPLELGITLPGTNMEVDGTTCL